MERPIVLQSREIAGAPVFTSEAEQDIKLKTGKATMTLPWAGAVWCFKPDCTTYLVRGTPERSLG
jgi:hypothetical protein